VEVVLFKWGLDDATKIVQEGTGRCWREERDVVSGLKTMIGTSALKRVVESVSEDDARSSVISRGTENCLR
jgi:hypothetical protein